MAETEYATMDSVLPEADSHIRGTREGPGGLSFWLTRPRPEGVSPEEWEVETKVNWERIFGKKERA